MTTLIMEAGRAAAPHIARAAGQVALAYASATIANAFDNSVTEGPRLESLRIQTSRDGAPMPRVFGRTRLAGQVIWASNFKEHVTDTQTSGSGKGGGPTAREYSYTMSFAIGLCAGEITGIERLWANGEPLTLNGINYRVHIGSETQQPDPIISLIDGPGAPAFRGTAYIVFEDFPLDEFGAHIPQINAEILRMPESESGQTRLEDLVQGVDLIPGSGEYVYAPQLQEEISTPSDKHAINVNNLRGVPDVELAIDQLQSQLPNCKSVNIVVSWFGDDLRCGQCQLRPGVESHDRRAAPDKWRVGGQGRNGAYLITQVDGKPVYGGTPSDKSLIDLIKMLKARGLKTAIYPFILMDIPASKNQPDYPWRGRISCDPASDDQTSAATNQVADFFGTCTPSHFTISNNRVNYNGPSEHSYRRMILHYAKLAALAGGVDSFIIGSEMRGLTTVRGPSHSYPAVAKLRALAADVRAIVGANTKLTYAADWSEYFGHHKDGNVMFHLDPLWADSHIDAVGIDAYFPLSDWRETDNHLDKALSQSPHNKAYLSAQVEAGEGYDYYYASAADRDSQSRSAITDGAYNKPWIYRHKDLRNWWSRPHYNRIGGAEQGAPTAWIPKSKPIWLTEVGCPAVDKGANQPNVFYDPKSSESFLPYHSAGTRDDIIQRRYLEALIDYWTPDNGHNPQSDVYSGPMIDQSRIHVWCWDARPYPDFPVRSDVWSDGDNWARGHWLSGRVGAALLPDVIREITLASGADMPDVSKINGLVTGYTLERPMSARAALEPLAYAYGFSVKETPNGLVFFHGDEVQVTALTLSDIALNPEGSVLTLRRNDIERRPCDVRLHYIDSGHDYQRAVASARDKLAERIGVTDISAPLVLGAGQAKTMCAAVLSRALANSQSLSFTIMPNMAALMPGDVITVPNMDGQQTEGAWQIERIDGLTNRAVTATPFLAGGSAALSSDAPDVLPPVNFAQRPHVIILDIPHIIDGSGERAGPLIAAYGRNFSPVRVSAMGAHVDVTAPTPIGALQSDLPRGPVGRMDYASSAVIKLPAHIASLPRIDMLAGGNVLAVETPLGWEVLQFERAELLAPDTYRISHLLRGQAGTDYAMADNISAGATIVLLGANLAVLPISSDMRGEDISVLALARGRNDAEQLSLNYSAVHLVPLSPVHAKWSQDGTDTVLSWTRRTRRGGDNWAAMDVPLAQEIERYEVDFIVGGQVALTRAVTEPLCRLTAADMAVIGTGAQARIYQISSETGRGRVLSVDDLT